MALVEKEIGRTKDGKPIILRTDPRKEISKENKVEYQREKRIKELSSRGYSPQNIAAMMYEGKGDVKLIEIQKAVKNKNIRLDGKL